MFPDVEELDEVVVTKSRRKSQIELGQEYDSNPNIIKTAYGFIDSETSAFRVNILAENQINAVGLCIIDLLRGQFAGILVNGNCQNGGSVIFRGIGSISSGQPAIFDVDGQILNDPPLWILPDQIERLAILPGLSARTAYGGIASGGVVVINTKTASTSINSGVLKDKARLRNNMITGRILTQAELVKDLPTYLQELLASDTFEAAKKVYMDRALQYTGNSSFYVDAYRYFADRWVQSGFGAELINTNLGKMYNNAQALKALAYAYQEQGQYELAHKLFKDIFILRPNYVQSYLDLAISYRDMGDPTRAANLFARYYYLLDEGFLYADEAYLAPLMDREFNNLLYLGRNDLVAKSGKKIFVSEEEFKGTRLVFEWDNGDAEFELQFVNPKDHQFTWKHTMENNAELLSLEKTQGFSIGEYFLDNSLPGTWKVNIRYLGNKSLTPTYLKATIYHNYGTTAQRREIRLYRLQTKEVNQALFPLTISSALVGN
jgi:tetratricopeptide (TPR) repeat protein